MREATAALPDADIELTETHHNATRDAPSGTVKTLLDDIEAVREDLTERVHGREGEAPRSAEEIGVHARRSGDRSIFADGALDVAEWLAEREVGWYDFFEVIEGE